MTAKKFFFRIVALGVLVTTFGGQPVEPVLAQAHGGGPVRGGARDRGRRRARPPGAGVTDDDGAAREGPGPRTRSAGRGTTARVIARRVLDRVDQGGAWATPALDGELARSGLDERDRRLAGECRDQHP